MGTRCNNCGWDNNDDHISCIKCGKPLFNNSLPIENKDISYNNTTSFFAKFFNLFKRKAKVKMESIMNDIPIQPKDSSKCPICGNIIELLLPCYGYDEPVVYKCEHCRCTITFPGTSIVTESGKFIPSYCKQESIISLRNGEIKFVGKIHGSVGWEYDVIYPQDAFNVNRNVTYCHPEMIEAGMCGGDEASVEYILKPLIPGLYCITEEIHFRGELEKSYIHYFLVE